jgi:hypothetical protein
MTSSPYKISFKSPMTSKGIGGHRQRDTHTDGHTKKHRQAGDLISLLSIFGK